VKPAAVDKSGVATPCHSKCIPSTLMHKVSVRDRQHHHTTMRQPCMGIHVTHTWVLCLSVLSMMTEYAMT
jgi:hypothetical protein